MLYAGCVNLKNLPNLNFNKMMMMMMMMMKVPLGTNSRYQFPFSTFSYLIGLFFTFYQILIYYEH